MLMLFVLIVCAGGSSVYTIDVHNSTPANFTNSGYVSTEGAVKSNPSNDGLPSYEEAIATVKAPAVPAPSTLQSVTTMEIVNEDSQNVPTPRGRRNRRHRHNRYAVAQNENSQPVAAPVEEPRRRNHRRGFRLRRHLAKINRRNRTETD